MEDSGSDVSNAPHLPARPGVDPSVIVVVAKSRAGSRIENGWSRIIHCYGVGEISSLVSRGRVG